MEDGNKQDQSFHSEIVFRLNEIIGNRDWSEFRKRVTEKSSSSSRHVFWVRSFHESGGPGMCGCSLLLWAFPGLPTPALRHNRVSGEEIILVYATTGWHFWPESKLWWWQWEWIKMTNLQDVIPHTGVDSMFIYLLCFEFGEVRTYIITRCLSVCVLLFLLFFIYIYIHTQAHTHTHTHTQGDAIDTAVICAADKPGTGFGREQRRGQHGGYRSSLSSCSL